MVSLGGSGSSSNNLSLSNGRFNQDIFKPQAQALTNLYNTAANTFGNVNGLLQGAIPQMYNSQQNAANQGLSMAQNLSNGGAYSGISGREVMNNMMGKMVDLNNIPGMSQMINPKGGDLATNIMALNPSIATTQNNMLDLLRPNRNVNNPFLDSGMLDPFTGVGKMNNTQKVYSDIMGGSGNNYADAMKGQIARNAKDGLDNALNSIDQRAAAGGMGGSTRQALAQGMAAAAANQTAQDQLNSLGFNTFDKDLQNKLSIAQQADTNATNRYQANLNYNQGLVNAGNVAAGNAMNYNTGLGGLGNQANQNNLNYNLGYGQNINQNNANAYGYGSNLYNAGMNYNTAVANNNMMAAGNALNYNGGIMSAMPGFAQGAQNSMMAGLGAIPGISGLYGQGVNTLMSPMGALGGYADAIGGPVVLGSGRYSSMGNGSSKGGGGGLSVMGG